MTTLCRLRSSCQRGLTEVSHFRVEIPADLYQEILDSRPLFSYDGKHPASMKATISALLRAGEV